MYIRFFSVFPFVFDTIARFYGYWSYPAYFSEKPELKTHGVLFLSERREKASEYQLLKSLTHSPNIFLQAKDHSIQLELIDITNHDECFAILRPEKPLIENTVYSLCINGAKEKFHNRYLDSVTDIQWTVIKGREKIPPHWLEIPKILRLVNTEISEQDGSFSSKPEKAIYFSCPLQEKAAFFVKVTVRWYQDNLPNQSIFYVRPNNSEIKIGGALHNSGVRSNFNFPHSIKNYEVIFQAIDEYGNWSKPTPPIKFTPP
mgnify:CR=1 FL=1